MQSDKCRKAGEIEVLRQNWNKSQVDISRLQVERIQFDEKRQNDQAQKEKEFQKTVEMLTTQLKFREREIVEAHTLYSRRQQKSNMVEQQDYHSPSKKDSGPSPRKSPRIVKATAVSSSPKGSIFPSQTSFMTGCSHELNKGSRSPKSASRRNEHNQLFTSSPKGKHAASTNNNTTARDRHLSCPSLGTAVGIKTRFPKGIISSTQLVGKLMETEEDSYSVNAVNSCNHFLNVYDPSTPKIAVPAFQHSQEDAFTRQKELNVNINMKVAGTSLSHLLNPTVQDMKESALELCIPTKPSEHANLPSNTTNHLAQLIPLVQEQLIQYISEVEQLRASGGGSLGSYYRSRTNMCLSSGQTDGQDCYHSRSDVGLSSGTTDGQDFHLQEDNNGLINQRETDVISGLKTLNRLCSYSKPICRILMEGMKTRLDEEMDDISSMSDEIDPSAPLVVSMQVRSKVSSSLLSAKSTTSSSKEPCRILQFLQKLFKLSTVRGHPTIEVRDSGWQVVCAIARNSPNMCLKWFAPFLIQDGLSHALSSDNMISTMMSAITTVLIMQNYDVFHNLCTQSDSCPLLLLYKYGVQCSVQHDNRVHNTTGTRLCSSTVDHQITSLRLQIIQLLLAVVSSHVNATSWLVETDCQCSFEVIGAVVFMMSGEFKISDEVFSRQRLLLLKQGLLLLHTIVMQTRALSVQKIESEMELIQLINKLYHLFNTLPQIDKYEASMLQDLWECVLDDEDEMLGVEMDRDEDMEDAET